jgi:small subunit ribosomal protein S21
MLIVNVEKEKNIEAALKKLKNKFSKVGAKKELLDRKEFVKKSVKLREQKKRAIFIQRLKSKNIED